MTKIVGDRARTRQRSSSAFCLSPIHNAPIGTVQSVDFNTQCSDRYRTSVNFFRAVHSVRKIAKSLPRGLKIKHYQKFWCSLGKRSDTIHFLCIPLDCVCQFELGQLVKNTFQRSRYLITKREIRNWSFCAT